MNCGIGVAVQTGYLFAVKQGIYKYVLQFDADGQHDAAALPRLVQECEEKQSTCASDRAFSMAQAINQPSSAGSASASSAGGSAC